jgi:hypothetical protein
MVAVVRLIPSHVSLLTSDEQSGSGLAATSTRISPAPLFTNPGWISGALGAPVAEITPTCAERGPRRTRTAA